MKPMRTGCHTASVNLGKRALGWGKGYAWNPVVFLDRAKDPADPELSREGFVMATGALVRSFDGPVEKPMRTRLELRLRYFFRA